MPVQPKEKQIHVNFPALPVPTSMLVHEFQLHLDGEQVVCDFYGIREGVVVSSFSLCMTFIDLRNQRDTMLSFLQRTSRFGEQESSARKWPLPLQTEVVPVSVMRFAHQDNFAEMTFYTISLCDAVEQGQKSGEGSINAYPALSLRTSTALMRGWIQEVYELAEKPKK